MIISLRQEGPSCGIYALGMALCDLYRIPPSKQAEFVIKLKNYIYSQGYSSLGELFNADNLANAGQRFCNLQDIGHIVVKTVNFSTKKEYDKLLSVTKTSFVHLLLPYFCDEGSVYPNTTDKAAPQEMYRAHWCVIEKSADGFNMFEGNKIIAGAITREQCDALFYSNANLADSFDWKYFLGDCEEAYKVQFLSRHPFLKKDFDNILHHVKIKKDYTEKVNLKNRAVIVGLPPDIHKALDILKQ